MGMSYSGTGPVAGGEQGADGGSGAAGAGGEGVAGVNNTDGGSEIKILDTFKHNGKVYEIRCWHDDLHHEWVARAFSEGRAVEGFVYSCADETLQDLGVEAFNEMIIRSIKSDVVEDRWGQVVKACSVRN